MKLKIKLKRKTLLIIFIIDILILILAYGSIIRTLIKRNQFAESNMKVYEDNENQVFAIEKIIICSSANAIDLSEQGNLQNLSIYQYTDIAIYISNGEELSNSNTIKRLYIDNISIEDVDVGIQSLTYKNTLNFGLKEDIEEAKETENIEFNIIYTNEENEQANYNEPTFFTDCSNPITLEYLNYDLLTNYTMDEDNSVSFDGSILSSVGIETESLECKLKFKVNIVNNNDEYFSCWINLQIPLDDIYEGTSMKAKTTTGSKYTFFKA